MDVILKQAVEGLGKPGDVVKVATGHARNYLFPMKLAVEATPQNMRILQKQRRQKNLEQDLLDSQRMKLAEHINGLTCVIQKQAGDDDKLFGSVSHVDILISKLGREKVEENFGYISAILFNYLSEEKTKIEEQLFLDYLKKKKHGFY